MRGAGWVLDWKQMNGELCRAGDERGDGVAETSTNTNMWQPKSLPPPTIFHQLEGKTGRVFEQ